MTTQIKAGVIAANAVNSSELASGALSGQNFTGDVAFDTTTLKIDSSNNRVGIGTDSPGEKLHIGGTAPGDSIIRQDATSSGTNWEIGERVAGKYQFWEDDSDNVRLTIMSTGNVGIGTSSPDTLLHLNAVQAGSVLRLSRQDGSVVANDSLGKIEFYTNDATNTGVAGYIDVQAEGGAAGGSMIFGTGTAGSASEAMRIASNNNVGIGTNNPSQPLTVSKAGDLYIQVNNSSAGYNTYLGTYTNESRIVCDGAKPIAFFVNGSRVVDFANGGNVGIGETNPDASLHITSNTPIISFDESDASQEYRIGSFGGTFAVYDSTDAAYRLVVDGSGNVGIGTTSPVNNGSGSQGLTINGTGNYQNLNLQVGGTTQFTMYTNGVSGTFLNQVTADPMMFYTSDTERMRIDSSGNVGIACTDQSNLLTVDANSASSTTDSISVRNRGVSSGNHTTGLRFQFNSAVPSAIRSRLTNTGNGAGTLSFYTSSDGSAANLTERMTIDSSGNLLVNTTNNSMSLKVCVNGSFGSVTSGNGNRNFIVNTVSNENWNTAGTVVYCGRNGTTGRSINAGGTVNASGADYAEYMKKADSCGTIAKGDVCGVDSNGKLTDVFADSISFVIKSTDPSYVGGDTWGEVDLGLSEEQTETERQKYDRIAFSGQVPVNITGSFNVGDYVYPQANGTDIECVAKSSPTFEEYQICVGKIWATEDDGRPLVAVKIG